MARSDDDEGWLLIERGAMLLVVNFGADEAVVDVPAGLEVLLSVGELGAADRRSRAPAASGSGRTARSGRREDPL